MNKLQVGRIEAVNLVESSLAHMGSAAEYANFRRSEQAWNVGLKGIARVALYNAAENFPAATARVIGRKLPVGMEYAGAGGSTIVYRAANTVTKVYKDSIAMPELDRQALARQETDQHELMRDYLGKIVAKQTTDVGPHPVRPSLRAVQTRQQFYPFTDLDAVFPLASSTINTEALTNVISEHPALSESLYNLADGSIAMAQETGFAPDIVAKRNIGYVTTSGTAELLLVDGQPIPVTNAVNNLMLPQLEQLRTFLDRPHAA